MKLCTFTFRTDDSRGINFSVVRKLVELPQGGEQCSDYLYFRSDGTQLAPYHCNERDPEYWNNYILEFCAQNFIEIIYRVRRLTGVGGKFWIQIQGNLHSNIRTLKHKVYILT